ncbi:MAG: phosphatase PAP2 family protein [Steroidobacteraceae bacterium]|nr:phosphatase PAP2 family protein [Steroidobacteraceae bacterium]
MGLQRLFIALVSIATLSGCSTLPDGGRWGEDATLVPGWERIRASAVEAARDPWVWGPLLGAAAFQIDDWDRRTADWARENTPVFGSTDNAAQWSDDLRSASAWAHYATILATPGGEEPGEWLLAKAKGALVQAAATSATSNLTSALKDASGRERPNGTDDLSFPSGHTSSTAVHARLASRNLESIDLDPGTRRALDAGLAALTIGTSWARIEAGYHFPSDTLVGMALGHFIGSFVNDAFLGLESSRVSVAPAPLPDGAAVSWRWEF